LFLFFMRSLLLKAGCSIVHVKECDDFIKEGFLKRI
jgi:hypothetical protein